MNPFTSKDSVAKSYIKLAEAQKQPLAMFKAKLKEIGLDIVGKPFTTDPKQITANISTRKTAKNLEHIQNDEDSDYFGEPVATFDWWTPGHETGDDEAWITLLGEDVGEHKPLSKFTKKDTKQFEKEVAEFIRAEY